MQSERKDQVSVVASGHGDGEVVVDSFLELVQHCQAMRGGEMDLRQRDGIERARRSQWMDRHGGLSKSLWLKYNGERLAAASGLRRRGQRPARSMSRVYSGTLRIVRALCIRCAPPLISVRPTINATLRHVSKEIS